MGELISQRQGRFARFFRVQLSMLCSDTFPIAISGTWSFPSWSPLEIYKHIKFKALWCEWTFIYEAICGKRSAKTPQTSSLKPPKSNSPPFPPMPSQEPPDSIRFLLGVDPGIPQHCLPPQGRRYPQQQERP